MYILNFLLASLSSRHLSKQLISLAAEAYLPLLPGLRPVLCLSHFLPVARAHRQQLSPTPNRKHVLLVVSMLAWLIRLAQNS